MQLALDAHESSKRKLPKQSLSGCSSAINPTLKWCSFPKGYVTFEM